MSRLDRWPTVCSDPQCPCRKVLRSTQQCCASRWLRERRPVALSNVSPPSGGILSRGREGCGQLGPQSTGPLSQLVPWALSPLTNLLVDKFTWRPNKWSPIIATFNFMVSFTPWNEWCEAFSKYYTAESTGIQQMYPYQELIYVYHSNGTRAFTSGSLHPLALPQRKTKPNCEADVAWESVMSEVYWWERVPGRWSLASRHTTGKVAARQINNLGKDICLTDQKLKKMQTMRVKESESVNSEAASRHR